MDFFSLNILIYSNNGGPEANPLMAGLNSKDEIQNYRALKTPHSLQ